MAHSLSPSIVVSHVYSQANNGDAALLAVLIDELRRVFNKPRMTALTMDAVKPGAMVRQVPLEPSLMSLAMHTFASRPVKFLYSIWVMLATTLAVAAWRFTGRLLLPRRLARATRIILKADLMVPVGGGYVRGKPDLASFMGLVLVLHPIWLAWIAGVPVMHHSQSVGPFGNKFQQWLAAKVLGTAGLIAAREDVTMRFLRDMGLPEAKLHRSVDAGFLFESSAELDVRRMLGIPPKKMIVGVTVRTWLKGADQQRYEQAVAALCDHIIKVSRAEIVFIPQVTVAHLGDDDRVASHRVAARIRQARRVHVMDQTFNADHIKALYSSLDLLIGTRFHSVIFSLTAGVPALAIEYEHKTGGIMQDLGLGEWVCDINTVTAKQLKATYDALLAGLAAYRAALHQRLPAYVEQTYSAADEIARRYAEIQ